MSGAPARRGAVGRVAVATTGSPQAAGWPRSEREYSGPENEQRATAPPGRGKSGFAGNEVPAAAHARGRASGEPLRAVLQVASMPARERERGAEPRQRRSGALPGAPAGAKGPAKRRHGAERKSASAAARPGAPLLDGGVASRASARSSSDWAPAVPDRGTGEGAGITGAG